MGKKKLHPEIQPGVRIQYYDKNEALRAGRVKSRRGNIITVINPLKEKTMIDMEQVNGYWQSKVKASPKNMIKIFPGK